VSDIKKVAYVFPGQGAQTVGMGKDLYENFDSVKALFKQADDAVGFPLSKIFFEGPEEELRKTSNAQPALVAVSFACLKAAQEVGGKNLPAASFMAGHSLGEYTALAAANSIDFATAVFLAKERGRLMYEAGMKTAGSMMAMLGIEEAVWRKSAAKRTRLLPILTVPDNWSSAALRKISPKPVNWRKPEALHARFRSRLAALFILL
jgi:[acyl-carrier-protein] S-malonyltransferase